MLSKPEAKRYGRKNDEEENKSDFVNELILFVYKRETWASVIINIFLTQWIATTTTVIPEDRAVSGANRILVLIRAEKQTTHLIAALATTGTGPFSSR